MLNVKSEISSVEVLNGKEVLFSRMSENVEFAPTEQTDIENDSNGANDILDISHYTSSIDASRAWNTRVYTSLAGTYKILVESKASYNEFMQRLEVERNIVKDVYNHHLYELNKGLRMALRNENVSHETFFEKEIDRIEVERQKDKDLLLEVSFDEWKNNRLLNGSKLSKELSKRFKGNLLEFYNTQKRNVSRETYYITITSNVQFIAGMSYYSTGDWLGMNGSSCMNPENEYYEVARLGASLNDDKLYVALLHKDLSDLEDMEGKLLGRSVMRLITPKSSLVDDKLLIDRNILIATNYYTNKTGILENAILELQSLNIGIMSNNVLKNADCTITENANGAYELTMYDEVYVYENVCEEVECECPLCNGSGRFGAYSDRLERDVEVECPACNGSGKYTTYVDITIDEYIEIEDTVELVPYNEGYNHYGNIVKLGVNIEYFNRAIGK